MDLIAVMSPQNSFLDPKGSVYLGEKAEDLKVRLRDYLSTFSGPKIFFREAHTEADTFFVRDKTHSIVNTNDFFIEPSLKKFSTINCDITRYNAFYNTAFDTVLKRNKIKSVLVAGVETHTSVLFTAEELLNRGIEVFIIEPLLASRDEYFHNFAVSLMINQLGVKHA
jgi:nicotinamidase-related amidase